MLLEKTIVGTVESGKAQTITLPDGFSIDLNGRYVNSEGNLYKGDVNVAIKYIPAASSDLFSQAPGTFFGENKNNKEGILETYGIAAIEISGSNGELLQISGESDAVIHIPIAPSKLANAPNTIPLWFFDEASGYWIEEGEASLVNGAYQGTVSHFTFWGSNAFASHAVLRGNVIDINGNPKSFADVNLISNGNFTNGQSPNYQGSFFSFVPANQTVTVEYIDDCGNILQSWTVGPYPASNSLTGNIETFQVTNQNPNAETVTGVLNDCNGNLVANGHIVVDLGLTTYSTQIVNGNINFVLNNLCSPLTSFDYTVYDDQALTQSALMTATVTNPSTNIGTVVACNAINEYVTFSIDAGPAQTIAAPFDCNEFLDTLTNSIPGVAITVPNNPFYAYTTGIVLGQYTNSFAPGTNYGGILFGLGLDDVNANHQNNVILDLTSYGPVGSYVDITISGTYTDWNNILHSVTGSIHVLRDS